MNTIYSKLVSPEDKKKILIHIQTIRPYVARDQEDNEEFWTGIRFRDDEEVFQAFCMHNINMEQSTINHEQLPQLVEKALISAGECDYHYNEKYRREEY